MIIDEKRLFRYMDIGFYAIFIPMILFLIPTDRIVEIDPLFFAILMIYISVTHYINRRYNPLSALFEGNHRRAAIVMATTLTLAIAVSQVEFSDLRHINRYSDHPTRTTDMKVRAIWVLFFIEFSFTMMLALVLELFKQIKSRQSIEEQKNRAEIALYKSQINPHFMLNSLNTLYGLYVTKSSKTGEVFLKFSDMIKYALSNSDRDKVMICDEVTYLQEYIDLHTLRLGKQTTVSFECEIDDQSELIPPMMLITFVENAFKYGVSSSTPSEIKISISLRKNQLEFQTSNTIFSRNHTSTTLGIKNCQRRLGLLYPNLHSLTFGEQSGTNEWITNLKIRL